MSFGKGLLSLLLRLYTQSLTGSDRASLIDFPTTVSSSPLWDLSHSFYFLLLKQLFFLISPDKNSCLWGSYSPYYSWGDFSEIKVLWILDAHRTHLQPSIKQMWATNHLLLSISQRHDLFNSHPKLLISMNLFLTCRQVLVLFSLSLMMPLWISQGDKIVLQKQISHKFHPHDQHFTRKQERKKYLLIIESL